MSVHSIIFSPQFFSYRQTEKLFQHDHAISQMCLKNILFKPEIENQFCPGDTHFLSCLKKLPELSGKPKLRGYSTLIWFYSSWEVSESNSHRRSMMVTALSTTVTWLQLCNRRKKRKGKFWKILGSHLLKFLT